MITGKQSHGPRAHLVHAVSAKVKKPLSGKVRSGQWNLYLGDPGCESGWPTPEHPEPSKSGGCGNCTKSPCLYDIAADIGEHNDVAAQNPDVVANLTALLKAEQKTCVEMDTAPSDGECDAYKTFGTVGPWVGV